MGPVEIKKSTKMGYDDKKAIADVNEAIEKRLPLHEIWTLASKVRFRSRKEFTGVWSPVHEAAYFDNAEAIEMLIRELGFRANAIAILGEKRSDGGNVTPAHVAVARENIIAFKKLLEFKPKLSKKAAWFEYYGTVFDFISQMKNDYYNYTEEFSKAVADSQG